MPQTNYFARVEAPISSDVQAMLQHPTGLQGRSMTVFVVTAVQAAAQQAIAQAPNPNGCLAVPLPTSP
jgi:uncharacterized protein (DUF1778 family)